MTNKSPNRLARMAAEKAKHLEAAGPIGQLESLLGVGRHGDRAHDLEHAESGATALTPTLSRRARL
jgi:hypothetical protein